jgi:hypothetical protein
MKLGIVRTGNVGCASVMAAAIRGSARKIVLVNRTWKPPTPWLRSGARSTFSLPARAHVLSEQCLAGGQKAHGGWSYVSCL